MGSGMSNGRWYDQPVFVLDFEASALGPLSYPIEIGLAWAVAPFSSVTSWSTLIRPTADWAENYEWNEASQRIHRINESELGEGKTPAEALAEANTIVGSGVAFVDGGIHDQRWLDRLSEAAGFPPTFRLADWDALTGMLSQEGYRKTILRLELEEAPHRAAADCLRLMRALNAGFAAPVRSGGGHEQH
jgi:DNA polymerase III subunit epsilon